MSQIGYGINKICTFAFNWSNMDTLFIDGKSQVKLKYGYNQVPEPLKDYFGNISNFLDLQESNFEYNVFFHSISYRMNFITAKVYDNREYLGSIVLGPYLLEEPTSQMVENVLIENKLSISLKHLIKQYYLSLPLISNYKAKLIAEFLAYNLSNLHSISLNNIDIGNITYDFQTEYSDSLATISQRKDVSIASIEQRYIIENEILSAVENGDKVKLEKLSREDWVSLEKIPDRIPNDPLRSRKNLAFVLNALLRKAAEKGGLHPLNVHSISEKFAIQIEKTSSVQQLVSLQNKMRSTYCNAVNKFSLKNFNYLIRKAIEFIRINLDGDLSLDTISDAINASPYELSKQFKKQTGESITEYINKQRINEAVYILENQNISITDTAYMVGFNDVNYFTKVFKKIKGLTPSQYRKARISSFYK